MKLYDVTMLINENIAVYKNKDSKRPIFTKISQISNGDSSNETLVSFNVHTGTHVDFPAHVKQLAVTSKNFNISTFIREVRVVDLTAVEDKIDVENLLGLNIKSGEFIFFKTRNSFTELFDFSFVYITKAAAAYLAKLNIAGVGIDALGVERDQKGLPTHHTLIDNNIWIIEGLRLKEVPEGTYKMIALPLKLDDVDALPLTVVLQTR